jgi:hypothetical protein
LLRLLSFMALNAFFLYWKSGQTLHKLPHLQPLHEASNLRFSNIMNHL